MAVPPTLLAAPVRRSRTPAWDTTPVTETAARSPAPRGGGPPAPRPRWRGVPQRSDRLPPLATGQGRVRTADQWHLRRPAAWWATRPPCRPAGIRRCSVVHPPPMRSLASSPPERGVIGSPPESAVNHDRDTELTAFGAICNSAYWSGSDPYLQFMTVSSALSPDD